MKKQIERNNKCKNCINWKSSQSELEYNRFCGICVSDILKFTIDNDQSAYLLDRRNRSEKYKGVQRFENTSSVVPVGRVEQSQYCLVTDSEFGCINFKTK